MALPRQTSQLVSLLPVGPVALPELELVSSPSAPTGLRLCAPTADDFPLTFKLDTPPTHLIWGRPLEISFSSVDDNATDAFARFIEQHLRVVVSVAATSGDAAEPDATASLAVIARSTDYGRRVAVRASPSSWALASAITLLELLLAGSSLPIASLPARIRVGFNHDPSGLGAVYTAAQRGDVGALKTALTAGGSTEELNDVSKPYASELRR